MKEIWRDIPGFEGLYQASNLGEIKSLEKEVWNAHQMIARPEKILKPFSDKKGYLRVKLYKSPPLAERYPELFRHLDIYT